MRNITDIYKQYDIMPNLALHQFRVAAVALQICQNFPEPLDTKSVVTACLLHDMGNIVKFRLRMFSDLALGEDIEHWEVLQKKYIEKYGSDDHHATMQIVAEIGITKEVEAIMEAIGFHNWCTTKDSGFWEHKIATYADSRVGPFGVLSLNDRLHDANKRYEDIVVDQSVHDLRDTLYDCVRDIEKEIFSVLTLLPEDINDASVALSVEELHHFEF